MVTQYEAGMTKMGDQDARSYWRIRKKIPPFVVSTDEKHFTVLVPVLSLAKQVLSHKSSDIDE